jgi:hypothetical protein
VTNPVSKTAAVVLLDAADTAGQPAGLFPYGKGTTLLEAVLELVAGFGAATVTVLAREQLAEQVEAAVPVGITVVPYADLSAGLAVLGELLDRGAGPLTVVHGDIATHSFAMRAVLSAPGTGSALLTGSAADGGVRVEGDLVVAAGSAVHPIDEAAHAGLGVLRIGRADRITAAAQCRELAGMALVRGWDGDLLDVLTVALVERAGAAVAAVPVGGYVWSRPRTAAQAERVRQRLASVDQRRVRLNNAARGKQGYVAQTLSPVSKRLAAGALAAGWAPSPVLLTSAVLGAAAPIGFATPWRWGLAIGAVLLLAAFLLQCTARDMARYARGARPGRDWLVRAIQQATEFLVLAALAFGAGHTGSAGWALASLVVSLQVFRDRAGAAPDVGGAAGRLAAIAAGDRWLVLAVAAVAGGHRAGLIAVLGLGLLVGAAALVAQVGGAVAVPDDGPQREPELDAGPLARLVGSLARRVTVDQAAAVAAGGTCCVAALAVLAVHSGAGLLADSLVILGVVVTALGWGRPLDGRAPWLVPGLLNLTEYVTVIGLAALVAPQATAAAFALLGVIVFHHYDTVLRLRHTGRAPSSWTTVIGLGYDGRLVVVALLAVAGTETLSYGLWALAVQLGLFFLAESVTGWRQWGFGRRERGPAEAAG